MKKPTLKKLLSIVLAVICIVVAMGSIDMEASAATKGVVTANYLTVRNKASVSSKKLGYLSKGTKVTIKGTKGNFYQITYNSKKGYISKSYVSTNVSTGDDDNDAQSGQAVVDYAMQFVGNPYVYGGTSLTNGCDCSGFVMQIYKKFGYSLPHSSSAMRSYGRAISKSNAKVGDIMCYNGHVAIYAGNGKIVGARNPRAGIGVTTAWYAPVVTVRRLIG